MTGAEQVHPLRHRNPEKDSLYEIADIGQICVIATSANFGEIMTISKAQTFC